MPRTPFSRLQSQFTATGSPAEQALTRYRQGLGVIMLFAVMVTVIALVMAGAAKQDMTTQSTATATASKLDNYISDNQQIPDSLATAGIKNVPGSISYKRVSDASYQLCVTYKAASDSGSAVSSVVSRGLAGVSHAGTFDSNSSTAASYADVGSPHKKGKNCQTVSPYIYGSSTGTSPATTGGTGSSDTTNTDDPGTADNSSPASTVNPQGDSTKLSAQATACGVAGAYATHYSGVIQTAVPASDDPNDDTITLTIKTTGGTVGANQLVSITINSGSQNVFDSTCASTLANNLYQGDYISVFQNSNTAGTKDTIVDSSL